MRNSDSLIIRSIQAALSDRILPELQSESGQQAGKIALTLLGVLLHRATPDNFTSTKIAYEDAREKVRAELAVFLVGDDGGVSPSDRMEFLIKDSYDLAHSELFEAQDLLSEEIKRLIKIRDQLTDEGVRNRLNDLLGEIGQIEMAATHQFLGGVQPQPQAQEAKQPEVKSITADALQAYLIASFPGRPNPVVSNVAGAGFSMGKVIHFYDVESPPGTKERYVIRQEKPTRVYEGLDSTLITHEYELMKCAYGLGMPVPEPVWLDTSGALGPDFMLMRRVNGRQMGEVFKAFRPLSEDMIMQIAEVMAKLHGAGLEPFESYLASSGRKDVIGMSTSQATIFRIKEWEAFCSDGKDFPNPSKVFLFDWLKRHVPKNDQPAIMVHGDFGIHNLLEEDGRITACLDWEWAHPGSPVEDLAYIRPHVDQYSNWERFLQHYKAHGGPDVLLNDSILNFYGCLSNAFFSILSSRAAYFSTHGIRTDMTSMFGGNFYGFEFQRQALEKVLKFESVE